MAKFGIEYADKPVNVQSTGAYAQPQTQVYEAIEQAGQGIFQIGAELQQQQDALDYSKGQRQIEEMANLALDNLTGDKDSDMQIWEKLQQDISGVQIGSRRVKRSLEVYRNKALPDIQKSLDARHKALLDRNLTDEFAAEGQTRLAQGDLEGYQDILDRRLASKNISQAEYEALSKSAFSDSLLQQARDMIASRVGSHVEVGVEMLNAADKEGTLTTEQKEYRNRLLDIAARQKKQNIDATGQEYWQYLKAGNFESIEQSLNDPNNPLPVTGDGGREWWYNLIRKREETLNQTDLSEQAKIADMIIFAPNTITSQEIRNRAKLGIHGGLSLDKVDEYTQKLEFMADKNSVLNSPLAKTFFNELKYQQQDRVFSVNKKENDQRYGQALDSLSDYFIRYEKKNGRVPSLAEAQEHFNSLSTGYRSATRPFTDAKIQTTLGELQSGGAVSVFGTVIPFNKPQDAVNHLLRNLGPNWQEIAPDALTIIREKWPDAKLNNLMIYTPKTTFEMGDTQIYNGNTYVRQADGQWHKVKP